MVQAELPSLAIRAGQGAILAAAMGVFSRLGFSATRVEDLLEATGIARRTFYKYFRSKEEVLAGIYELTTHELLRAIELATSASDDPLVGIRSVMDGYLDFHAQNGAQNGVLLRMLVEQAVRADSPLAPIRKRFRDQLVEHLSHAAQTRGGRPLDALLGIALVSALEGVSLELLERGATTREVTRAKRTMHLLLGRAFGPRASE